MKSTPAKEIVLDVLLMAVWLRRPKTDFIIHSDQGDKFSSDGFNQSGSEHKLVPNKSRREINYDNAAVESLFSSVMKEIIGRLIFKTHEIAKAVLFAHIKEFYNSAMTPAHRKHQSREV